MDIGLHYIIVFELMYRLCNLCLHYKIGIESMRNQEKGVLAKCVSAESSVTLKETEHIEDSRPSSTLALRASQPREAYSFAKPLF